jgi:hypothetical protein
LVFTILRCLYLPKTTILYTKLAIIMHFSNSIGKKGSRLCFSNRLKHNYSLLELQWHVELYCKNKTSLDKYDFLTQRTTSPVYYQNRPHIKNCQKISHLGDCRALPSDAWHMAPATSAHILRLWRQGPPR